MKVALISGHAADSDRKTGFHFWAEILAKRSIDVKFLTVGFSPLTLLKKNRRQLKPPYNAWVDLAPHIQKYTWMPIFHPMNLHNKFLNWISWPLFFFYPMLFPSDAMEQIKDADLIIVESGAGLMLVRKIARANKKAKFIYNVSDWFDVVPFHPIIPHSHKAALLHFSFIRLNSSAFKRHFPDNLPVQYIPQAIDKNQFDQDVPNPYAQGKNAISMGDMLFDGPTIEELALNFPDWTFHIFGKKAQVENKRPNIIEHGEFPHEKLIPYLKHADIGLAPYADTPNAEYLSESSLKLVQYTYCQLPIVAPEFAAIGRDHVMPYKAHSDRTPVKAFEKAISYNRSNIDRSQVVGWEDMVDRFLKVVR